jgi:uncharacterized membrane protein
MKRVIIPSLIFAGAAARVLMAGLPNIEPVMLVTLVSGYRYGAKYGLLVGALTMLLSDLVINGFVSFAMVVPASILVYISLITNATYGFVGFFSAYFKKYRTAFQMAGVAALLTVIYDVITAIFCMLPFNMPIPQILIGQIPFTIAHVLGNVLIVGVCAPYLFAALDYIEAKDKFSVFAAKPAKIGFK